MQKIFIVEDDENIRELVAYALSSAGFEADGFETGARLYEALERETPELILLDIMLPGVDGVTILRELRSSPATSGIPVIMLTAKSSEYDKIKGLDSGADDYVTKPFGVMELLSRVKAVLRRTGGEKNAESYSCGGITLDPVRHLVFAEDTSVTLTFKEFELLQYLLQNHGIVLTREKIMERVWGFDFEGESRTVDMHIKTLRQKLGASGALIETVRGVGYKIGG